MRTFLATLALAVCLVICGASSASAVTTVHREAAKVGCRHVDTDRPDKPVQIHGTCWSATRRETEFFRLPSMRQAKAFAHQWGGGAGRWTVRDGRWVVMEFNRAWYLKVRRLLR